MVASTLLRREFRAMGTTLALTCPDAPGAERRLRLAERWAHAYEGRLSRFIPYSELSRLNNARGTAFRASPLLFEFVSLCLQLARRSGGIFDPTLLHEVEAAGYDRTFELIDSARARPPPARTASYEDIRLDERRRMVTLPLGLALDSGGLGKGWAADRLAALLGAPCLVDCGGDLAALGHPPGEDAWYIAVEDPLEPQRDLMLIGVVDRGVATSSVLRRRWETDRGAAHHLIDPRSGLPASTDAVAVTVVAPGATLADFHAKVALLKGAQAGLEYLDGEAGVEGLVARADGSVLRSSGFSAYVVAA
ncbi:MAG TPA: FAD:protein FMN transferase [Dehalococcoidia bacterium]|nr:FAD:protein FMN transferase [Dehalococcoidia bacterium]